ncbi:MAG: lipoyl(octanoyl) transferase [Bdellovibrionales bacterium GWC1_52_8]|nr:MAG: lipoyl(octanoyl) transferase [Bdellovibrionales bacterium GWB1_52_6]OFZ06343.1 MAG: lipoyl(octanoyl) transferase [Bdellovibrionales bacterium GWA1_52_35]OFZ36567.1 MAG: lipoyl(octanoyl) transferase [Bdellovibrionales bacterium GWC1_52_8]HCM40095.1 lipoyl(octanoyl) transferase [Bdellovibrionales bacterium]
MQLISLPGLTRYSVARELQLKLVERRADDLIPDTVLFLEHYPVITQGRGLQFNGTERTRHMPLPAAFPEGVEFSETERGGDLTYHGPGQLVIYPICKLDGQGFGPARDVEGFVRKLEGVLIQELSASGVHAESRPGATGVWVGDSTQAKKVASVGIAVRKWVTYHGMAINCVNDLSPFGLISPCGFSPEIMGRLSDVLAPDAWSKLSGTPRISWRKALERALARRMSVDSVVREVDLQDLQ